jgi:hypothetical protein
MEVSAIGSANRTIAKKGLATSLRGIEIELAYQVEIAVGSETSLGLESWADWLDACFPT